jgi:four helix bundle protein
LQDYRKLVAWNRAHGLALRVYEVTSGYPREEVYALTSQTRRAASSIPANIAEGCGRSTNADLARFLYIAIGSGNELEYHLLLARDLKYLPEAIYESTNQEVAEVKKMLSSLLSQVRSGSPGSRESSNFKLPTSNFAER